MCTSLLSKTWLCIERGAIMEANALKQGEVRVNMCHVNKRFDDVVALNDASLSLQVGEVHALLGENGAGKTTLMNILSGLYRADDGQIEINSKLVHISKPLDAIIQRIGMVHQHFELIANFTALENIILGREGSHIVIDIVGHEKRVTELSQRYGLRVNLRTKVKDLAIGNQQKVEILKALYRGADILILDEPTTMLTPQEVDHLFQIIRQLVDNGLTVVLITHKIHEVLKISDRITIMRRGKVICTITTQEADEAKLVALMMGAENNEGCGGPNNLPECANGGKPLIRVNGVTIKDKHQHQVVNDVSFEICSGQIIGLVGVAGNGQLELAEAIAGLRPIVAGKVTLLGEDITRKSIRYRLGKGITLVPEDRIRQGILPHLTVSETMMLGVHHFLYKDDRVFHLKKADQRAQTGIREFDIRTPSERTATCKLSGGNIQKVLLARAFLLDELVGIQLMIAFNPTRGLDIMTTRFVHSKLASLRAAGKSTLLISEDLDEAMELCDRILVVRSGRLVGEVHRDCFDRYQIGAAMVGGEA